MEHGKFIYRKIKEQMKSKNMNQSDMAKRLKVSRANVSILLNRTKANKISFKSLMKLSEILECDIKFFL